MDCEQTIISYDVQFVVLENMLLGSGYLPFPYTKKSRELVGEWMGGLVIKTVGPLTATSNSLPL